MQRIITSSVTPGSVATRAPLALAARRESVWVSDFDVGQRTTSDCAMRAADLGRRLLAVRAPADHLDQQRVVAERPGRLEDSVADGPELHVGDDQDPFAGLDTHAVSDGDQSGRMKFG